MPKATKLHAKGKPNSIQKPCKVEKESSDSKEDDSLSQFQLELCWCIQQLERSLNDKKNEKQMQEAWKVLTVLKNNNQPMIRKRQLMRTHFGDYRAKMASEEKKLAKMASKMKITESPVEPKATFLRKSLFSANGNNSFRFNFNLTSEQEASNNPGSSKINANLDNTDMSGDTDVSCEVINENVNNIKYSKVNTTISSSNPIDIKSLPSGDDKDTQGFKNKTPEPVISAGDSNTQNPVTNETLKVFKFKFSNSQFRFNFDVDNK